MIRHSHRTVAAALLIAAGVAGCLAPVDEEVVATSLPREVPWVDVTQVPAWPSADLDAFLHGSIGAEVIPERVLQAFIRAEPDLFRDADLTAFGLIPDPAFGWPVGFSRRPVPQLAGLSAVGVNCAACHVAEIVPISGRAPVRVLGAPGAFDAEAFFGAVTAATLRATGPAGMRRFLAAYLGAGAAAGDRAAEADAARRFDASWEKQEAALVAALAADPTGSRGVAPGVLHDIDPRDLGLDVSGLAAGADLVPLVRAVPRLLHNVRAALGAPDQASAPALPPAGPGRRDAFGLLLAAEPPGAPRPYAPVKHGVVWNLEARRWVQWDGSAPSPVAHGVLAALASGARRAGLDLGPIRRQADLARTIRAPQFPLAVDAAAVPRGAETYEQRCARCHDGPEGDARLHAVEAVGTDPRRARSFTAEQAGRLDRLLAALEAPGTPPPPGLRATGKYWAPDLAGVWARAPYLHNGSVRTLEQLLTPPAARARTFRRGTRAYDDVRLGFTDEGPYLLDTAAPGNSNAGHDYGTDLPPGAKQDLIEYLKTR